MTVFSLEIAGQVGQVEPLFESTRLYFANYLTDKPPDFAYRVTGEDLQFEQQALRREAEAEGMRIRVFTDPFLERVAIQRRFAEHLLTRDTLLLHGSVVAVDGNGYLFTASCGTGKSTHTRLWMKMFGSRAVMINDDKPFLRLTPEGVLVCGSPWSGKHGLETNVTVPLKGICLLNRGQENRIVPMESRDALPMLLRQSYAPLAQADFTHYHVLVTRLSETVPLWHMFCNKEPQAALVAFGAMSAPQIPRRNGK